MSKSKKNDILTPTYPLVTLEWIFSNLYLIFNIMKTYSHLLCNLWVYQKHANFQKISSDFFLRGFKSEFVIRGCGLQLNIWHSLLLLFVSIKDAFIQAVGSPQIWHSIFPQLTGFIPVRIRFYEEVKQLLSITLTFVAW